MRSSLVVVLLGGCTAAAPPASAEVPAQLLIDTASYANASCLAAQEQPYLRKQGERWAGAIIQRGAGPVEAWSGIADEVRTELARSGVAQGQPEGPGDASIDLPVLTCGEIGETPMVQSALARARARLAPFYRARSGR